MSQRDEAEEILDDFLYENIWNRNFRAEPEWDITYITPEFILRHRDSGEIYNFRVSIEPGTLTEEEIKEAGDDQEWWENDE